MSKTILDLLDAVGVDNIEYQTLNNSLINAKQKKKNTELTFATNQITATDVALGTGKRAIIIWVDSDLLSDAYDKVSE
tara:strand:- start:1550 stop:1783 length:234 start_codon:yes stop_codon:yes gene_type:complete